MSLKEVIQKQQTDLKEKMPEMFKTEPVVEKKKPSPKASPVKNVTFKEPMNDTSKDAVQKTANDGKFYIFFYVLEILDSFLTAFNCMWNSRSLAHQMEISYYVNFLGRLGSNRFQLKFKVRHFSQLKKSKS